MTYIPDVRKKMITKVIGKAPEENAYWEGYLDDGDKKWLKGFDWAADQVLSMIFDCIGDLDLEVEVPRAGVFGGVGDGEKEALVVAVVRPAVGAGADAGYD